MISNSFIIDSEFHKITNNVVAYTSSKNLTVQEH